MQTSCDLCLQLTGTLLSTVGQLHTCWPTYKNVCNQRQPPALPSPRCLQFSSPVSLHLCSCARIQLSQLMLLPPPDQCASCNSEFELEPANWPAGSEMPLPLQTSAKHHYAYDAHPPACLSLLQMLVFYTWSVRFTADAISMMSSTEKIGWLATKTPQEGEALYEPDVAGGKDAGATGKKMISVSTVCEIGAR